MCAPTLPRITFAPPGESSTLATSPGAATVTAEEALDGRGGEQIDRVVDGPAGLQRLAQQHVDRGPWRPPSAVVVSRFRQTPRPASLRPILASIPASVSVANQRSPSSTIQMTVEAARVGVPVPVLGEQTARTDHGALVGPGAGQDLGARVDRDQFALVHACAGGDPGDLLARLAG